MKNFIQFIVYSNLWISCGAVSFTLLFYSLFEAVVALNVLGFIFFATFLTYTFQRFKKLRKKARTSGQRMERMIRNKILVYVILIIGVFGTAVFGLTLSFKSMLYLLCFGLISFLYVFKIKKNNKEVNTYVPVYNSRDTFFKKPFGAVQKGSDISFNLLLFNNVFDHSVKNFKLLHCFVVVFLRYFLS